MFSLAKSPILGLVCGLLPFFLAPILVAADQSSNVFASLRAEHDEILKDLNTQGDKGRPLALDDDRVPLLLKRGWTLSGKWAAAYLDARPAPTARQMKSIFKGFAPSPQGVKSQYGNFLEYHTYSFDGRVVRIAPTVYIVQAHYFMDTSTGMFLVITRDGNGRFQPVWNIKDVAEKHYPVGDEIGRWVHLTRRAYYNGPLDVNRILPLSPTRNGHPRFLVDAFQSAAGGTALAQLSIWEWTGADATPLLIKIYKYTWDGGSFHLDGNTLRIGTKEEVQSFFSCGQCSEPKGTWTIRITPTGVTDVGHRFLQPELQWTDELLSKISEGKDATGIAQPTVVNEIKSAIEQMRKDEGGPKQHYWGMFDTFHRLGLGMFELRLDEARLRFTYVLRKGKPYFTKVRIDSET